jgi:predicted RNA-binding Zn-ribbon protein involved in translation (DUF1610 family)
MTVLDFSTFGNLEAPSSGTEAFRVPCPKCGGVAVLVAIEPAESGFDKRTFRCSSCGHHVTTIVKVKNASRS